MTTDLTCRETVELLMDYVESLLPATDHARLEAHLAICPKCLEFLRAYRETPRILREATAAEMPAELRERLRQFLRGKRQGTEPPKE